MILADSEEILKYRAAGAYGDALIHDHMQHLRSQRGATMALIDPSDRARVANGHPCRLTWAEVGDAVDRVALTLIGCGVCPGNIIVAAAPTIAETLIVQLAVIQMGAIVAPIAVQAREHEVNQILDTLKPKAIITFDRIGKHAHGEMCAEILRKREGDTGLLVFGEPPSGIGTALEFGSTTPLLPSEKATLDAHTRALQISADDIAIILFTSGSEAAPKAVPRSHNNYLSNQRFLQDLCNIETGSCILSPRMLNTVGAMTSGLIPWLTQGLRMVLHHPFDLDVLLQQIADEQPEYTSCPPAVLKMMLDRDEIGPPIDLTSLHHITSGSAQLSPDVVTRFRERFGIEIINIYGSTEGAFLAASESSIANPSDRARYFAPIDHTEARLASAMGASLETCLIDLNSGEAITEPGLTGELRQKGPSMFPGYWQQSDMTDAAIDENGFYKTGDLFEWSGPSGQYLKFVGRQKNIIVRGGLNISADEISTLLSDHIKVHQVALVPVPHPILGEKACAIVVPKDGCAINLAELNAFLLNEKHIATFKQPEHLIILDNLPVTATGKPDLTALRDIAAANTNNNGERT